MPRRLRTAKAVHRPAFDPLYPWNPGFASPAQEEAYWREHRAEWIEWHQSRYPGAMPEPFWKYEVGTLTDDTGPIDWRDYLDDEHYVLGHVTEATMVELAHAQRLAERRAEWLAEHPELSTVNARDLSVLRLLADSPARRRRVFRRAGIEAVRRRLDGPTGFRVAGTDIIVSVGGTDVATYDPWDDCAHD